MKHGGYELNQGVDPKTLWIKITLLVPSSLLHGGETLCAGSALITPLEHQFDFTLTDLTRS